MKIGFTGTRHGLTVNQAGTLSDVLEKTACDEFHHGDCLGADAAAAAMADNLSYWVVSHPPTDPRARAFHLSDEVRPPKPYLERNHDIVDETDVLIVCPAEYQEQLRSGTWATFRYARRIGRPVVMVWPDGRATDSRAGA